MTILDTLLDGKLFGRWFADKPSWASWRVFLAGLFGLAMSEEEMEVFTRHTGRETAPTTQSREAMVICGRRAGKSRIAALVAVFLACFRDWRASLAPGETAVIMVIAVDKRQAKVIMSYIKGFLDVVPLLKKEVVHVAAETITLKKQVTIEVKTCSFRSVRGYTLAACILDELAFFRSEESSSPDFELITGVRPGLASLKGSLLLGISSPYSRTGFLFSAYDRFYGKEDASTLIWQSDTASMNPSVDPEVIAEAYLLDENAASSEYGGLFRRDIEQFVSREVLDAAVVPGRTEQPFFLRNQPYRGFVDPSGGSQDSFSLAIAHKEGDKFVLDLCREQRPPFSPEVTVLEFSALLKSYRVSEVTGDRYAGEWVQEPFRNQGITYKVSEQAKSDLYLNSLPLLNSGKVELLDHVRLKTQILGLERRTGRSGRGIIDHAPKAHDDLANSALGLLSVMSTQKVHVFKKVAIGGF